MQSVIVYRNPLEAMMWDSLMNSNAIFPVMAGVVVFFIAFFCINKLVERQFGWGSRGTPTNINLLVSAAIAIGVIMYMV